MDEKLDKDERQPHDPTTPHPSDLIDPAERETPKTQAAPVLGADGMDVTEEDEPRRIRIDRVMRAQEITDRGEVVITFWAEGRLTLLEMSQDDAADLSSGLASAVETLKGRNQ